MYIDLKTLSDGTEKTTRMLNALVKCISCYHWRERCCLYKNAEGEVVYSLTFSRTSLTAPSAPDVLPVCEKTAYGLCEAAVCEFKKYVGAKTTEDFCKHFEG